MPYQIPYTGYSQFKTVQSGVAPGSQPGLLPMDGAAAGMRYQKEIYINVSTAALGGALGRSVTGDWIIQLLSPSMDVLFEQEVTWSATVIGGFDPLFGIPTNVIWYPNNNGDGVIKTTNINGNVIDPATGYQYLDRTNPTPASEFGITIDEGGGGIFGNAFSFYANWTSPAYKLNLPEGSFLKVVQDHWQFGTISREATYSFSFKNGSSTKYVHDWRVGSTWIFYQGGGKLLCNRTRYQEPIILPQVAPVVTAESATWWQGFRHGKELLCLYQSGNSVRAVNSGDEGKNWNEPMNIVDNVTTVAAVQGVWGDTVFLLGKASEDDTDGRFEKNDQVRAVLSQSQDNGVTTWVARSVNKIQGDAISFAGKMELFNTNNTFLLSVQDSGNIIFYVSNDECLTWAKQGSSS